MSKTFKFSGFDCVAKKEGYIKGGTCLRLTDPVDGSLITTASIWVAHVSPNLHESEFVLKDYSENTGILDALVSAGIVKPTGEFANSGLVRCPIVRLLGE